MFSKNKCLTVMLLSGCLLSTYASAEGQSIEASVDLAAPAVAQATWTPISGLDANIGAGKVIGQFDVQLGNATTIVMTQTTPFTTTGDFALALDGQESTDQSQILNVNPEVNGQRIPVSDNRMEVSQLTDSSVQIKFKKTLDTVLKPGHYTANFQLTTYQL